MELIACDNLENCEYHNRNKRRWMKIQIVQLCSFTPEEVTAVVWVFFKILSEYRLLFEGKYLVKFSNMDTRITPPEIALLSFLLILNRYWSTGLPKPFCWNDRSIFLMEVAIQATTADYYWLITFFHMRTKLYGCPAKHHNSFRRCEGSYFPEKYCRVISVKKCSLNRFYLLKICE